MVWLLVVATAVSVVASAFMVSVTSVAVGDEAPEVLTEFVIAPQTAVVGQPDEQVRFDVLLNNLSDVTVNAGLVTLWMSSSRVEDRAELETTVFDPDALSVAQLLGTIATDEIEAGKQQRLTFIAEPGEKTLQLNRESGVYVVHAKFAPQQQTAHTTFAPVVWGEITAAPVPLTYVVPLVLPDTIDGVPNRAELDVLAPKLLELLTEAEENLATLAVDPRIVTGIRALGADATSSATELLDRLERTPSPHFMLQFADADPAAQAALGFDRLLQPLGFSYLTDPVDSDRPADTDAPDGTSENPSSTPQPTSENASNALLDDEGQATVQRLTTLTSASVAAWPAPGSADEATLSLLKQSGISSIVLDSTNVNALASRATLPDFQVLVSDASLAHAARDALGGQTIVNRRAAQAMLAGLTALDAQEGVRGVILALDRGAVANVANPRQVFTTLNQWPWIQPVPEGAQPEGNATFVPQATDQERLDVLTEANLRSSDIDELAPLLTSPSYLTEYQRVRLMHAFATGFTSPTVDTELAFDQMQQRDEKLLRGVSPVLTKRVNLVGASSEVPVTLRNWLPFEASVQVRASPVSATIVVTKRTFNTTVVSGGTQQLLVPVKSRVSNGDSGVLIEVRDIDGTTTFASDVLPITLRTNIETVLLITLGGAAALLLAAGTWRSVKRVRTGKLSQPAGIAEQ